MITRYRRELAEVRALGPMPAIGRNWIYSAYRSYRRRGLGPWGAMFLATSLPDEDAMRLMPSFSPDGPDAVETMGEYVALVEAWRARRAGIN